MLNEEQLNKTTMVDLLSQETQTDPAAGQAMPEPPDIRRLRENYAAIIRDRAIYYPVAYRLEKTLGRGRQGIVFLGLRQGARGCITYHAIKLFDPVIYPNTQKYWNDMGRIADQISRLQAVRSPNLVDRDVYEETNGIGYVQMEAIDGVDLGYFLDGRHLERARPRVSAREWAHFTDVIFRCERGVTSIQPGVALYIMRQTLRGLEVLHDKDFIHSDIKPANIMIDGLGNVKIVDFGRAVRKQEKMSILLGSPLYMAPEIHRRESGSVESDIYSVGLVGLEMLRGTPLVDTSNMSEADLLAYKMRLPEELPRLLPPHVLQNATFVALLRRFIDPDPGRRFHRCADAESGEQGLRVLHKQLTTAGKDAEYGRELETYLRCIRGESGGEL